MKKVAFIITILLSLVAVTCEAQKDVTKTKKCPAFPPFTSVMPKPDIAKAISHWSLIYHEASNGLDTLMGRDNRKIEVALVSPEVLSAALEMETRKAFLKDSARQLVWEQKSKEFSEQVTFSVRIFIAIADFRPVYANPNNWAFVLLTEDDRRISGAKVEVTDAGVIFDNDPFKSDRNNWHMVRLKISFHNDIDDKGHRLLDENTKAITLGIGGDLVRLKARFEFDAARK